MAFRFLYTIIAAITYGQLASYVYGSALPIPACPTPFTPPALHVHSDVIPLISPEREATQEQYEFELMLRVQRHADREAFDLLARSMDSRLDEMTARLMKYGHDRDDLKQEILLRMWERRASWRDSVRGWVWAMMRTLAFNKFRKERRIPVKIFSLNRPFDDNGDEAAASNEAVSPELTPPAKMLSDEHAKLLDEIISTLSEVDREVIILYYYAGIYVEDIARILEVPEGTIKRRLFMARQRLLKAIEERELREFFEIP